MSYSAAVEVSYQVGDNMHSSSNPTGEYFGYFILMESAKNINGDVAMELSKPQLVLFLNIFRW